ncbi:MAG: phosphoribosylglycinamide formyltransferase [Clostridia bacterium]
MLKKVSIAVFVSGGGTNLQALIDAQKNGILKSGNISIVISSNPAAYALKRAEQNGIPTYTVEKKQFQSQIDFENEISKILSSFYVDLIVLAGFMCILSEDFTSKYPKQIVNIHPSLIPSFCGKGYYGLRVHEAALKRGVKITGATVHFVNEIPDGGEIIYQKAVKIKKNDTPEILQKRVMEQAEQKILPLAVEKVCANIIKGRKNK